MPVWFLLFVHIFSSITDWFSIINLAVIAHWSVFIQIAHMCSKIEYAQFNIKMVGSPLYIYSYIHYLSIYIYIFMISHIVELVFTVDIHHYVVGNP